jgi:uncharacterized glyoxalase superfamily protein PhnB
MQVQPYLFFDGRCDEAIDFYKLALGAEVMSLIAIATLLIRTNMVLSGREATRSCMPACVSAIRRS